MVWCRFTADYDYRLPSSTTAYKAGMVQNVTRDCAVKSVAAGKAARIKTPRKGEAAEIRSCDR